jgi:hypothetical protein
MHGINIKKSVVLFSTLVQHFSDDNFLHESKQTNIYNTLKL